MDNAVIAYYRKLSGSVFEHSGSLEEPSIFLKNFGDFSTSCHGGTDDFMNLYINVIDNIISDIKYRCICDPTTNVAVEILCTLVKGKPLDEVADVTQQAFSEFIGSEGEDLKERGRELLEKRRMVRAYRLPE